MFKQVKLSVLTNASDSVVNFRIDTHTTNVTIILSGVRLNFEKVVDSSNREYLIRITLLPKNVIKRFILKLEFDIRWNRSRFQNFCDFITLNFNFRPPVI